MIALPIDTSEPYHDLSIELDGATRNLKIRYHARESRYYVSVYDVDGNAIQLNIKVLCDTPLLKDYARASLPGQLWAHSNTPDSSPPELGELGLPSENVRVNLFYLSEEECAALVLLSKG